MPSYRHLHEEQVRQNRPDLYCDLKRSGDLQAHLDEIAESARQMQATIVRQMAERHPYDPAEWKGSREAWVGWIERTAEELVLHDIVLMPDAETEKAMRDSGYAD